MSKPVQKSLFGILAIIILAAGLYWQWGRDRPPAMDDGIAIKGYDLVSLNADPQAPMAGLASHQVTHQGRTYRFANARNAAAFAADPGRFLPQYDGHCAWAAAHNYSAPGDPDYARSVNGKLYFNYNAKVQDDWLKDVPGFIVNGDRNWPAIKAQLNG